MKVYILPVVLFSGPILSSDHIRCIPSLSLSLSISIFDSDCAPWIAHWWICEFLWICPHVFLTLFRTFGWLIIVWWAILLRNSYGYGYSFAIHPLIPVRNTSIYLGSSALPYSKRPPISKRTLTQKPRIIISSHLNHNPHLFHEVEHWGLNPKS